MKKILRLKSWQIFGLIIIMPILFIILGVDLAKATGIQIFMPILALISALTLMISYYGWIWNAGIVIYNQGNFNRKLNLTAFKLLFILAMFLFLIITPILKKVLNEEYLYLLQIIGLISVISFFYCIYFITESIRNLEKQRNAQKSYLLIDFILIWILPIGIWILQPRIKEILSYKEENAQ